MSLTKKDIADIVTEALKPIVTRLDAIEERLDAIETDMRTIKTILEIDQQVENLRTVLSARERRGSSSGLPMAAKGAS